MGELHIMVHTMEELHIMVHTMGELHIASAEKLYNWQAGKMQLAAKAGRVKHIFAITMEVRWVRVRGGDVNVAQDTLVGFLF